MKNRINKTKETGPFLRQEFIPEKRIQRFAVEELTRYSLLPGSPGPVDIEKFCDRKWGFPEDYQALDADVMHNECSSDRAAVERRLDRSDYPSA